MAIIQLPRRSSADWGDGRDGRDGRDRGDWRNGPAAHWDEAALSALVASRLASDQVIVVSDRQPFSHEQMDGKLCVSKPASGLVTAVEPIVRACGGTWIAHGSGGADRETVNDADVCFSPEPGNGYRLRRLWMSELDTRGYRNGFANAGLWPLCHMVHVRPAFIDADWQQYQKVNRRFAEAVVDEANQPDPVVFIHDYHLALLPAMVRERLPRATIVSFWHIPWTSPEQMGICPWLPNLVEGLLGSDIVGFQTDRHRQNFVDTAERCARLTRAASRSAKSVRARNSLIHDYPISVAWPVTSASPVAVPLAAHAESQANSWTLPAGGKLIVGIDRFDYTKGLVERLHALEHLLDHQAEWRGRLKFVQVAAPSRASLPDYVAFRTQVFGEVRRINAKFATARWEPIALLDTHHDHSAVQALYAAADVCVVTSLHDGMNLVSKEFVAARSDEQGVLVLSEFAGAAHELHSALIVNPYHTAQVAAALHRGLLMPVAEQRARMQALRATVKKNNVYRWAAHMLLDVIKLRDARGAERQPPAAQSVHATA